MNQFLNDVHAFNQKFDLDNIYNGAPQFLPKEIMEFRIKFLLEELQELSNACGFVIIGNQVHYDANARKDLEKALDGLVDLLYVLKGTVLMMGFGHIFDEAWRRVQEANMSKVRATKVEDSKRKSTIDVVKPPNWKAPEFKDLLSKIYLTKD